MEAFGAAASVFAIVEIVGRVSASAASFMRDIKDARKDMIQVRKDMSDLSTVLRMVAEDLDYHGDNSSYPNHGSSPWSGNTPPSQQHIVGIALSCRTVLLEIETVLRDGRSRLSWVTSGKERVDRLRARLETCKLSLDVALDYRTMVVVHDIKVDSTRIVGDVSAIQRDVTLLLGKVDNIERKASGSQDSPYDTAFPNSVMLDRFLNECRTDAQTVLDNIEYQQDQHFEYVRPKPLAEAPELTHEFNSEVKPGFISSPPSSAVLLKTSLGHEHKIALEQCRKWSDMFEIIKSSYRNDPADTEETENSRYTRYHDGQLISPASWGSFADPGRSGGLKLWKDEAIDLSDAVGRKYHLPWSMVKTWKGMEGMIKEAFLHVEVVGDQVDKGYYDLLGPDDTIIMPVAWEQAIKPGMSIKMRMWPDKTRKWLAGQAGGCQLEYAVRPGCSASIQEERPPATATGSAPQPRVAEDSPLEPTGLPAPQQLRQKQDTSLSSLTPKTTQRLTTTRRPPGLPVPVVDDRPMRPTGSSASQPSKGSSRPKKARPKLN